MINPKVLKMELKRSFKNLLGWTLSIGIFMYLILILYPLVKDIYAATSGEIAEILKSFGGIPENEVEYFAMEGGMLLQLFGAVFAAMTGFSIISREEREQTTDLICSLPVSRTSFFFTKLLAASIQVIVFSALITIFCTLGFLSIKTELNLSRFFFYMLIFLILLLMVQGLGFALACFIKHSSKSLIALLIPLPLYILTFISSFSKDNLLKKLKYLSPFTFSEPVSFLKTGDSFEYISFTVFSIITIVFIILALILYRKREFTN